MKVWSLIWTQESHCIDFKILLITYKALNGLAPQYLSELLSHYSPPRLLRSQNSGHLIIPKISKSTAGGRSFFYLAPKLWNNLPNTVREAKTLCQFKSRLKTHLFNLAYTFICITICIKKDTNAAFTKLKSLKSKSHFWVKQLVQEIDPLHRIERLQSKPYLRLLPLKHSAHF